MASFVTSRENGGLKGLSNQNASQYSDRCPECNSINKLRGTPCNHLCCIYCNHFFSASVCPKCRMLKNLKIPIQLQLSEYRNRETQSLTNVQGAQTSSLTTNSTFPSTPCVSIGSQENHPNSNASSISLANSSSNLGAIGSERKSPPLCLPHEFETGSGARSKQPVYNASSSPFQLNTVQNQRSKEIQSNESMTLSPTLPQEEYQSSSISFPDLHLNDLVNIPSNGFSPPNYQSDRKEIRSNEGLSHPVTLSPNEYRSSYPLISNVPSNKSVPIPSNGASLSMYQSNNVQNYSRKETRSNESLFLPKEKFISSNTFNPNLQFNQFAEIPSNGSSSSPNYQSAPISSNGSSFSNQSASIPLNGYSSSIYQPAPIPSNGSYSFNHQSNGEQGARKNEIRSIESVHPSETCPPVPFLASSNSNYIIPQPVNIPEISSSHNIDNSVVPKCCNNPKAYCISCEMLICYVCQVTHIERKHEIDYGYLGIEKRFQETIQTLKHNNADKYNFAMKEDKKARKGLTNQSYDATQEIKSDNRELRYEIMERGEILHKQVDTKTAPYFQNLNVMYEEMKPFEESKTLNFLESYSFVIKKCQEMTSNENGIIVLPEEDRIRRFLSSWGVIESDSKPAKTEANGQALKNLILKQKTYFYIECKNHLGDRTTCKKEDLEVSVTYPNKLKNNVAISFNHDFYQGYIETDQQGEHAIDITLRGMDIHFSTYKVNTKERKILSPHNICNNTKTKIVNFRFPLSLKRGWGICYSKDGFIFVTDKNNHCIWVFNSEMGFLYQFGRGGNGDGEFRVPCGITIDDNNRIIVADKDNHRIQVLSRYGKFIFSFGSHGSRTEMFHYPWDVATNSRLEIAVTDFGNNRVQLFDKNGKFLLMNDFNFDTRRSSFHKHDTKDSSPRGICFYGDNHLFVTEFYRKCVYHLLINRRGNWIEFIRRIKFSEDIERPIEKLQGIIIADGYMFIAEAKLCRIIMINMNILDPKLFGGKSLILQEKHFQIMTKKCGSFFPSNLAASPDGTLIAIHHKEGILYQFNVESD